MANKQIVLGSKVKVINAAGLMALDGQYYEDGDIGEVVYLDGSGVGVNFTSLANGNRIPDDNAYCEDFEWPLKALQYLEVV